MTCDFCQEPMVLNLRGTQLCNEHAIEALDHGAGIVVTPGIQDLLPSHQASDYVYVELGSVVKLMSGLTMKWKSAA